MRNTATEIVRTAIANTANIEALQGHWKGLLSSRAGKGKPQGSYVPGLDEAELLEKLRAAQWEDFEHPAIAAPAQGFITRDITGVVGLVSLAELDPETPVRLCDGHATGYMSAVVVGGTPEEVDFVVLLVGPNESPAAEPIVWTFHPGNPVRPSSLELDAASDREITAAEAIKLGFDLAKIEA